VTDPAADVQREIYGDGASFGALLRAGGIRPTLRIGAAFAWTGACLVGFLTGMGVLLVTPRLRRRWRHGAIQRWARGLGRIVGMRARLRGPRPTAPFFLVANHLSYLDIVLLLGHLEGVFVAKHELGRWPILGYLTRLTGTIFLNRSSSRDTLRAMEAIEARIGEGDGVIVFPEGTSSGGDDVYPMKPALFEWAARRGYPVHVASIEYRAPDGGPSAREALCWWGDMAFLPHVIALCRMRGFDADVIFGPEPLVGDDRGWLAGQARARIADLRQSDQPWGAG